MEKIDKLNLIPEKVRENLAQLFDGVRDGTISLKESKIRNSYADKVLKIHKLMIACEKLKAENPDIEFPDYE